MSGPGGGIYGSALRRRVVPRGAMDEVSSVHVPFLVLVNTKDALKIVPLRSSDPIMEGPMGPIPERSENPEG